MASIMIGLCLVAAAFISAMTFLRWYRNPEYLRWLRIEKRARIREAADRAAAKYASLPSITVVPMPPLAAPVLLDAVPAQVAVPPERGRPTIPTVPTAAMATTRPTNAYRNAVR